MTTITIPKKIILGKELVAIPREEYEEFSEWRKTIKTFKTFTPTSAELRDLKQSREDYKKGNYMTIHKLKYKLGIKN